MKKYQEPEIFDYKFSETDVLNASTGGNDPFKDDLDWGGLEDDA